MVIVPQATAADVIRDTIEDMTTQTHRYRLTDPGAAPAAIADAMRAAKFRDITTTATGLTATSRHTHFAGDRLKARHTLTITGDTLTWEHTTRGKSQANRIDDVTTGLGHLIDDGGLTAHADQAPLDKKTRPLVHVAATVLHPGEPVLALCPAAGSGLLGKFGVLLVTDTRLIVISGTDDDPRSEVIDRPGITGARVDRRGDTARLIVAHPGGETTFTHLPAAPADRIMGMLNPA